MFPDVERRGCVKEVDAVEESADTAGRGLYFYGSSCDECCGEFLEAVTC